MRRPIALLIACLILAASHPNLANAHPQIKKAFQKKYDLKSASCNACHLKGKEKKRNDFGKIIEGLVTDLNITERVKEGKEASKAGDKDKKKEIYDQIEKDVLDALKKLDDMEAPSGKKYSEAIPAGEIEGTKLKEE